jgi:DNA-binding response OmpR family regulator
MDLSETHNTRLLIVEDDDQLTDLLLEYLQMHGFEVSHASTGDEGAQKILDTNPDLAILDLMLPGMNGLDVCRRVRNDYMGSILMLTASQSEADHVAALELGADDFVVKPIEPRVLLARIRTQLRRRGTGRESDRTNEKGILNIGSLQIDIDSRTVSVDDQPVLLTTMEFNVLSMLARDAGNVVKRDDLYTDVIGIKYDGIDRGLDVHVSRIRRKLKRSGFDPSQLKSVRGLGYLLAYR